MYKRINDSVVVNLIDTGISLADMSGFIEAVFTKSSRRELRPGI